jgi:hypothetical protein
MAGNVIGHFHRDIQAALIESEGVDDFDIRRLGEGKQVVRIRFIGDGQGGAISRVAADTQIFDAECFKGGDEPAIVRAKKMIPVRVGQDALHFKAQTDKIRRNPRAWMLGIQLNGDSGLSPTDNRKKAETGDGKNRFYGRVKIHMFKVSRVGDGKSGMYPWAMRKLPKYL